MSFEVPKQKTIVEAMSFVEGIRTQIEVIGANDYESSALDEIQKKLTSGGMSPEDAIAAATAVKDFKQDYR